METGNITLTFETPDMKLTGDGVFDISQYFNTLFTENTLIKEELSAKIASIFKNIKVKDVSEDWTTKIKDGFNLKKGSIDLKTDIQDKAKDAIKKLKIDVEGLFFKTTSIDLKQPILNKVEETIKNLKLGLNELSLTKPIKGDTAKGDTVDKNRGNKLDYNNYLKRIATVEYLNYLKRIATVEYSNYLKRITSVEYLNYLKRITSVEYLKYLRLIGSDSFMAFIKNFSNKKLNTNENFDNLKKINVQFINDIVKIFENFDKILNIDKIQKTEEIPTSNPSTPLSSPSNEPLKKDTTFESPNEVIVSDFTEKALDKLSKLIGNIGPKTLKEEKKEKKPWMEEAFGGLLDEILGAAIGTAIGVTLIPFLTSVLLPALLLAVKGGFVVIAGAVGAALGHKIDEATGFSDWYGNTVAEGVLYDKEEIAAEQKMYREGTKQKVANEKDLNELEGLVDKLGDKPEKKYAAANKEDDISLKEKRKSLSRDVLEQELAKNRSAKQQQKIDQLESKILDLKENQSTEAIKLTKVDPRMGIIDIRENIKELEDELKKLKGLYVPKEKKYEPVRVNDWIGKARAIITEDSVKVPHKDDVVTAKKITDTNTINTPNSTNNVSNKRDMILDNMVKNMNKQLEFLNKSITNNNKILNDHTKVFMDLLGTNEAQLKILPALIPAPANNTIFPSSGGLDQVNVHRTHVYDYLGRR